MEHIEAVVFRMWHCYLNFMNAQGSSHICTHEEILPLKYFIPHDETSRVSILVSAQFRDPFVYIFHCLSVTS